MDSVMQYLDLDQLVTQLVEFIPHLVTGLIILSAFWILFRVTRRPLRAALIHTGLQNQLVSLLVNNIYRYALMAFGIVMALSQLGVNVGAAIAGLGVAGIAVGLAAQDTLSNTIAGFTIFWDKPFVVGDHVTVTGQYGMVQEITLRSTRIRTPRNSFVVIPNKRIIDEVLENDTKNGELRVDISLGIAYKEDISAARDVLLAAVGELDGVMADPEPQIVVTACSDSSVDLEIRVWVRRAASRQEVNFAVIEAGKRALDAAGIQIPFPHLQLFWDDVEDRVVRKWRSGAVDADPAA